MYQFAVEPRHDRETLASYIEQAPHLAAYFVSTHHEICLTDPDQSQYEPRGLAGVVEELKQYGIDSDAFLAGIVEMLRKTRPELFRGSGLELNE